MNDPRPRILGQASALVATSLAGALVGSAATYLVMAGPVEPSMPLSKPSEVGAAPSPAPLPSVRTAPPEIAVTEAAERSAAAESAALSPGGRRFDGRSRAELTPQEQALRTLTEGVLKARRSGDHAEAYRLLADAWRAHASDQSRDWSRFRDRTLRLLAQVAGDYPPARSHLVGINRDEAARFVVSGDPVAFGRAQLTADLLNDGAAMADLYAQALRENPGLAAQTYGQHFETIAQAPDARVLIDLIKEPEKFAQSRLRQAERRSDIVARSNMSASNVAQFRDQAFKSANALERYAMVLQEAGQFDDSEKVFEAAQAVRIRANDMGQ